MADACMTQLVGCCAWGCGCCLACGLQVGSSPFIWSVFVSVSRAARGEEQEQEQEQEQGQEQEHAC